MPRRTDAPGRAEGAEGRGATAPAGHLNLWVIALVIASVVFGGASRDNPIRVMLVEVACLPLFYLALRDMFGTGRWREAVLPIVLLSAIVAIPLVQLIPLPPGVWLGLPGRDAAAAGLNVAGLTPGWLPFSLTPGETRAALLALGAPVAMFLATQTLEADDARMVTGIYLTLAVLGLVLGSGQLFSPPGNPFYLYRSTNQGSLVGFFANRNHEASFLLACLPFAAVFAARRGRGERSDLLSTVALFMIVLTIVGLGVVHSRAGLLLAVPALLGCVAVVWRSGVGRKRPRTMLVGAGLAVAAIAAVLTFALAPNLSRFSEDPGQERRLLAWPYIEQSATQHLPFGSGIGSFDRVYRDLEPLELISPTYLNHAHNDYLELWLETGWAGATVLAAVLAWLAWMTLRAWRRPPGAGG